MRFSPWMMLLLLAPAAGWASPIHYDLPPETAELAPGPDRDAAGICVACHSVDYIATQPRRLPNPAAFWTAEVAKMRRVYGAPIGDTEAGRIVDYLVAAYPDNSSGK
jgi:sulfite dehydrogenase (cytochrome) subunit B